MKRTYSNLRLTFNFCLPFAGLVKFIPEDQMQNRMAILLCNLKPSKMRGINSEAMVMCASTPEKVCQIFKP